MHKFTQIFKDKKGKWAIAAFPNGPLLTWILLMIIGMFVDDVELKKSIELLGSVALFIWAYLEVAYGASTFRRLLGLTIFTGLLLSYFT